jgi:CRISPR system Cascade subunit CasA
MTASFKLADGTWIPAVRQGGRLEEVSLRTALTEAHTIDDLGWGNPLETAAILRQVLLPIYLDACGFPDGDAAWVERFERGRLDADRISRYLDDNAHRFDLFGDRPFAQAAGLRTAKDETKPVSLLIASAATGNNVPLFGFRTDADPPALTPAEAARALLATHCWDTAGIKTGAADDKTVKAGKTTGNHTGPLGNLGVIIPIGRNLAETILLNTPYDYRPRPHDRPQWMADLADAHWPGSSAWSSRPVKGLLDLLTWQSRRIRLHPEVDPAGNIVVRRVVVTAGDRMDRLPEYEPHTAWRRVEKPKAGEPPHRPIRHIPGRAAWRGLEPMVAVGKRRGAESTSTLLSQLSDLRAAEQVPTDLPVQVVTVGLAYGTQNAVVEEAIADRIPLPVAALDPESEVSDLLISVVSQAEKLQNATNRLGDDLRRAVGGDKLPWDKGQRIGDELIQRFSPLVNRILVGLQREPDRVDEAEEAWRTAAERLAWQAAEAALAATPPAAFLGQVVKNGAREERVNEAIAGRWFGGSVRKILGR